MMSEHQFTWIGTLMVFWAIMWRCIIILLPFAVILGIVIGVIGVMIGMAEQRAIQIVSIAINVISFPIYIAVLRRLFVKGFGKYRLEMVEK